MHLAGSRNITFVASNHVCDKGASDLLHDQGAPVPLRGGLRLLAPLRLGVHLPVPHLHRDIPRDLLQPLQQAEGEEVK